MRWVTLEMWKFKCNEYVNKIAASAIRASADSLDLVQMWTVAAVSKANQAPREAGRMMQGKRQTISSKSSSAWGGWSRTLILLAGHTLHVA